MIKGGTRDYKRLLYTDAPTYLVVQWLVRRRTEHKVGGSKPSRGLQFSRHNWLPLYFSFFSIIGFSNSGHFLDEFSHFLSKKLLQICKP